METLRKLIFFMAMLFIVFAVLVLLDIISVDYLDSHLTTFNPTNFYKISLGLGAFMVLLVLAIDYMYTLSLKSEKNQLQSRINELKAALYDRKPIEPRQPLNPPAPVKPPTPSSPDNSFPNRNPQA